MSSNLKIKQHIFSGAGTPTATATTPTGIGQHYIDTATGDQYLSVDTTAPTDFILLTANSPSTQVLVSANDTTPNYLFPKVTSTDSTITLAEDNDGGDENLDITVDQSNLDHTSIQNIGTNTHAQIDTHIASTANPHTVTFTQAVTADGGTDISAAEAETLTDTSDASSLHNHDTDYFTKTEHIDSSAGAGDAGKPIKLDGVGQIDASMINDGDISHLNITDIGTNTHAQIDTHIADATIHFTEGSIDHDQIMNAGSNTHAQIDTHIGSTTNPHSVTLTQVLASDGSTDITTAELETLTDGSNANSLHKHSQLHETGSDTLVAEAVSDLTLEVAETASIDTASANKHHLGFKSDNQLYRKDDAGKELLSTERNMDITINRTGDLVSSIDYGNGESATVNRDGDDRVTSVVHDRWTATVTRSGDLITDIAYT